jgi:uncharacterized caspase-like protein
VSARSALIVGATDFQDSKLQRLRAPTHDAEHLGRVLADAEIGNFSVEVSLNEPEAVVRRKLSSFFRNRQADDLLLLHLSSHGIKDEDGHLYFAAADTELADLDATAVASGWLKKLMDQSRSRRIVLTLDCCHSGAFARGMLARSDPSMHLKERLEGRGRAVLTASDSIEYAFDGDELSQRGEPSLFTSALVEGLETGAADRDEDGQVSVSELYDYVHDWVRARTPSQTPCMWAFDVRGELYIAKNPHAVPRVVELPQALRQAMENQLADVRAVAVQGLIKHGRSDPAAVAAVRAALEDLLNDDSRRVSEAAAEALRGFLDEKPSRDTAAHPEPPALVPAPPPTAEPVQLDWVSRTRVVAAGLRPWS